MCTGYRDEFAWWESAVFVRRFFIAAVAGTLGGSGHGHQAVVAILGLAGFLCAQVYAMPYSLDAQNRLELASLVTAMLSLLIGVLFVLGALGDLGENVALASIVVLNVCFVVALAVECCRRLLARVERTGLLTKPASFPTTPAMQQAGPQAAGAIQLTTSRPDVFTGPCQDWYRESASIDNNGAMTPLSTAGDGNGGARRPSAVEQRDTGQGVGSSRRQRAMLARTPRSLRTSRSTSGGSWPDATSGSDGDVRGVASMAHGERRRSSASHDTTSPRGGGECAPRVQRRSSTASSGARGTRTDTGSQDGDPEWRNNPLKV